MTGGRTTGWLLAVVLVASFALRLIYALPDPGPQRFWDERYGFENIERLFAGDPRPAHGFHPGLSYLPQALVLGVVEGLHRVTGNEALAVRTADGGFTATAYRVSRLLQVVFSLLELYLLFLIGRRLGGERVGLIACLLLSVVPWHVRQSAVFKADIVLLLSMTLAFWLALRAVDRWSAGSFALAGGAIGLALASKFNGGPIAVPLAVGALLEPGRRLRAVWLLALAAATSVAVFVALDPYVVIEPEIYRRSMSGTLRTYKWVAQQAGTSRWFLPLHAARTALSPTMHGPWIGVAALGGAAVLAVRALRGLPDRTTARRWGMALSFPVAYVVLYAVTTPKADPHNWLPLTPFLALAAAWSLSRLWGEVAKRTTGGGRRLAAAGAVALLLAVTVPAAVGFVYRGVVRSSAEAALGLLHAGRGRRVTIVFSEPGFADESWRDKRALALAAVPSLAELPERQLDLADAEVFGAARLGGDEAAFYRSRMERVPAGDRWRLEPSLFRLRGAALVVVAHPQRSVGSAQPVELVRDGQDARLYRLVLPARPRGAALVSFEYRVPEANGGAGVLLLGRGRLPTVTLLGRDYRWRRTTPRFRYRRQVALRLDVPGRQERIGATVRWWRRARPRPARGR